MPSITTAIPEIESKRARAAMLVLGMLLVAANLRAGLTSVGPLLNTIQADLGLNAAVAGFLNSLPLLAFAAVSPTAPALGSRLGLERALFAALVLLTVGIAVRSVPSVTALFIGTAMMGVAIAVGNVLLPALIKRDFPNSIAMMTSAYATVMGSTGAIASGVVVPISGAVAGGWRTALACWLVLSVIAAVVWGARLRGSRVQGQASSAVGAARLPWRCRRAWLVTGFMGLQSLGFYVMVTWLPSLLQDAGISEAFAGWLLFLFQAVAVVASLGAPMLLRYFRDQRLLAMGASIISLLGYLGFVVDPHRAVVWTVVAGIGGGACLVLALAFLSLRADSPSDASALSAMAQSIGYLFAAVGPLFIGWLHSSSDGWWMPIALMCVLALTQAFIGLGAGYGRVARTVPRLA